MIKNKLSFAQFSNLNLGLNIFLFGLSLVFNLIYSSEVKNFQLAVPYKIGVIYFGLVLLFSLIFHWLYNHDKSNLRLTKVYLSFVCISLLIGTFVPRFINTSDYKFSFCVLMIVFSNLILLYRTQIALSQ
jgi:hypothetical protein